MRYLARVFVAGVLVPTVLSAAEPAPEGKTGLKVGTKAPAFTLRDQAGNERKLGEFYQGDGMVALVFYRSASW
jgi:hypothetical protein